MQPAAKLKSLGITPGRRGGLTGARPLGNALQRRDPGLKSRQPRRETLVLLASRGDHVAQNLDFLPGRHVHVLQKALGLTLDDGLDFAADALRSASRVGDEAGEF